MATRTAPITRQVAIDGTPKHLGDVITEEGKFRLTVPKSAASSVWLGDRNVVPAGEDDGGDPYVAGSATQLPTISLNGWYAVTDGASVTITLACATGGADAPDWLDAGTASGGDGATIEAALEQIEENTGAVADVISTLQPLADAPALNVALARGNKLEVEVASGQTATATPDAAATGIVTRLAGITSTSVGEGGNTALDVNAFQAGSWTVSLGPGDSGKPQYVQGSNELGEPERLATKAGQDSLELSLADHATTSDVQEVRDRLPAALEDGRLAVETELDATGQLATEAKQDVGNASLSSIDTKTPALVGGRVPVDGSGVTQPISAASLPLPSGAATSALQGGGLPAALVGGRLDVNIGAIGATVPISAVSLPLPTGAATSANQSTIIGHVDQVETKLDTLESGKATAANQATGNASLASIDGGMPNALGTSGGLKVEGTTAAGASASSVQPVLIGGVDPNGKLRSPLFDAQGRPVSASVDFFGRLRTEHTQLVNRGYVVRNGSTVLFSKFEGTGGTVTYSSTNGTYDSATTTTAGSVAIDIHNKVIHYRESFVFGATISGRMTTTTATNNRKEWGLTAGLATSAAAILAADGCGFYYESGVLGIFYRSSISATTTQVAQSAWNVDKLDGLGPSGFTFTVATALLDLFVYEVSLVWLGSHGIQFKVGNRIVHEVDFTAPGSRTQTPYTRIPHMRPYVMNHNNNASVSSSVSTFNRNCLTGYVNTFEDPQTYPFSSQRTSGITLNVALTTFPVMLLRVNSAAPERILLPEGANVRTTTQDTEWIAYIGKSTDFVITGGAWTTPPNNPDTQVEYNITATAITIGAGAQRVPLGAFVDISNTLDARLNWSGFLSEEHRWVGINGDGVQLIFALCAVAQAGNNAVATVREFTGKELG